MKSSSHPEFAERLAAFVSSQLGVSPEEMPEETEWRDSGNTIGALCLRLATLDFAQVEEILDTQGPAGELFGSTALRLGFLTEEVLDGVLALQRVHRALDTGGMLVLQGRIDLPALLELLGQYFTQEAQSAEAIARQELESRAEPVENRRLFGLHLVSRGRISELQLMAALERQRVERVSIGRLAYESDLMTIDQVVDVLNRQPSKKMLYGEIAVSLGYLSEEQRDGLLEKQLEATIPLGQLLVQMGTLDAEVADAELARFHAEGEALAG